MMTLKRISCLLTATAILLTSTAIPVSAEKTVPEVQAAFPTAQEIVNDIVIGWNLGNTLDNSRDVRTDDTNVYEQGSGMPTTTQKMIQDIHAAGFNAIRIPVTWMQKLDENDQISEAWMNRVQEIVDWAYDDGMYVILNVHHDTNHGWMQASYDSWNQYQGRFASIWTQISERFADYDYHLIFEGFNEIICSGTNASGSMQTIWGFWEPWQQEHRAEALDVTAKYNQLFVDTVRRTGGNNDERILLCNTYAASGDTTVIRDFLPPEDTAENRLIVGTHLYMPNNFAGTYSSPDVTTYSSEELKKVFDVVDYYIDAPVLIGEFNAKYKSNDDERNRWAQEYLTLANERGYKCFVWDTNSTPMGLYHRQSGTWLFPEYTQVMLEAAGAEPVSLTPYPDFSDDPNLAADPYVWTQWSNRTGMAYAADYTDSSATLRVIDSGEQANDVMLNYGLDIGKIPFEEGREYRVSFDIACDGIEEITDASLNIGYTTTDYSRDIIDLTETLSITPETVHYEFNYTPSETHDRGLYFYLHGGEHDSYTVTVSDLEIYDKDSIPEIESVHLKGDVNCDGEVGIADAVLLQKWLLAVPDTHLPYWQNADVCEDEVLNAFDLVIIKRMLLWADWKVYNQDLDNSYQPLGADAFEADIREVGTEHWYAQVYKTGLTLEQGKTYQLTFTAEADDICKIDACVQESAGDYKMFLYKPYTLTTEPQTITEEFTMNESCGNAKLAFDLGHALCKSLHEVRHPRFKFRQRSLVRNGKMQIITDCPRYVRNRIDEVAEHIVHTEASLRKRSYASKEESRRSSARRSGRQLRINVYV